VVDVSTKPQRSYTKLTTGLNIAACWLAIGAAILLGREMAAIVVPIMATLIAALAGVYQTIGHFDLRALAALSQPERKRQPQRQREAPPEGQP